jgi:hypothetical protein
MSCAREPSTDIRPSPAPTSTPISITLARAFHDDPVKLFLTGGTTLSRGSA